MSTAVLSILTHNERVIWDAAWLDGLAIALLLITTVLAAVLAPRYVRPLLRPGFAHAELGDPDTGSMLATVPAGLLLLACAWGTVGPLLIPAGAALAIDAVLATIGAALALWVGMMWATSTGRDSKGLAGVNGSWLIPPVCTMLVATAIAPLVLPNPGLADVLLLVGYGFLGAGLFMFVVMLALLVARLVLDPNLPGALAPTMWVPLAPAGILGIAAIRLTQGVVGALRGPRSGPDAAGGRDHLPPGVVGVRVPAGRPAVAAGHRGAVPRRPPEVDQRPAVHGAARPVGLPGREVGAAPQALS